jgi:transcriptional regulator with XRE-family HTH domain
MTDSTEVTRRLKELRERAGLSVRAMAQRVGMSSSGYSHYETPSRFKDHYLPMAVAMQIARALDGTQVHPDEVMDLAGSTATAPLMAPPGPGMAESATAFDFHEHPTDPADPQRPWRALFGQTAATPATFMLLAAHPAFGLLQGDVLICDMARVPRPGELALVTITDEDTASSVTTLRRYLPPYLASCDISDNPPLRTDQPGVTVRYPVIGSIRGLTP